MKKVILIWCAAVFALLYFLHVTDNSPISIEAPEPKDYREACKFGDYEAAMRFIDELEEAAQQAKRDIPGHNLGFLGIGGNEKEYRAAKEKYHAAQQKYDEAKKYVEDFFTNKMLEGPDDPENFDAVMKRVEKMHYKYLAALAEASHDYRKVKDMEGPRQVYWSSLDQAYKKEIMYLVASDNAEAADRIVFLLNEIPIDGTKKEGLVGFGETSFDISLGQELLAYITYVEHYNNLCDIALDLAINRQNKDMAKKIVRCYKPDVIITRGKKDGITVDGVLVDKNHGYVQLKNNSKESASKKLKEAIDAGDFD